MYRRALQGQPSGPHIRQGTTPFFPNNSFIAFYMYYVLLSTTFPIIMGCSIRYQERSFMQTSLNIEKVDKTDALV